MNRRKDPTSMRLIFGPNAVAMKLMFGVLLGCLALLSGPRANAVEQQIVTGINFTVTLAPDGTVWTWGDNFYGQLGTGNNTDSNVPVQVSGLTNVIAVASGFYHALALQADGTVWAWGYNGDGQLGQGGSDTTDRNLPVVVGGISGIGSIAAGGYSSYAISRPSSNVYAWGRNDFGQIGNASSGTNVYSATLISAAGSVRKLSAGAFHVVAIRVDGTLVGWGYNGYGNVGDNTTMNRTAPVVLTGAVGNYIDIASGVFHNVALRTDGRVYTWGADYKGQLGNGSGSASSVLQPTITSYSGWRIGAGNEHSLIYWFSGQTWYAGDPSFGQGLDDPGSAPAPDFTIFQYIGTHNSRPQAMVSGHGQHVALVKANGTILTWGNNSDGQLGNGTSSSGATFVAQSIAPRWSLDRFIQVSSGDQHSTALRADGTVWCWGSDGFGQLGNDATQANSTIPVQVSGLSDIVEIAAGAYHSIALNASGSVSAWGYDQYGQLGDNDTGDANKFVPVTMPSQPYGVRTIGAGGYTSYLVYYSGSTIYGCGYNGNGALGLGVYTSPQRNPVATGFSGVLEVDGGALTTVALLANGQVRTSGYGFYGTLGINTQTTTNTVQSTWTSAGLSSPLDSIFSVAAGGYHVTTSRTSGATRSWGRNTYGQVGNGVVLPPSPDVVLAPVGTGSAGKHSSAGPFGDFSLVLLPTGTVRSVGYDDYGQLGNDSNLISSSSWTIVSGLSNICAVSAGTYHSLALGGDGTLYAWGYNNLGVHGTGTSGDYQPTPITVNTNTWKPQVSVDVIDGTAGEAGANTATFRFSRSFTNGGAVTVNYILGGTATNGTDYTTLSGTATIPSGQTFVDVTLTPTDDPDDEDTETVDVTVASGVSYRIGSPSTTAASITDNDTSSFTITGISANTQEADQASTTARTFTVRLNSRPSGNVVLNFASSNTAEGQVDTNTAVGNQGATALTFNASDWNTPKTVQVFGQNDDFDDGDIGYVIVITVEQASTADGRYDLLDPPDVGITNIDNDTAAVVISAISGPVTEAGGTATFTITLASRPYNPVNFTLSSSDTSEGVLQSGSSTVTINPANWNTGATITVVGVNDDVDDGNQAFKIDLNKSTSSDPAYNNLGGWDVALSCTDDDTKGVTLSTTTIPTAGLFSEGGASSSFTVRLNSQPTAQVTVTINTPASPQVTVDTDEGTIGAQNTLTFTTANWNITQTVRVTAVDDAAIETSTHVGTIQSVVNAGTSDYTGVTVANITCNITDNDTPGFTVLPTTAINNRQVTTESGGTASFTVRLKTQPTGAQTVTLRLNSTDLSEGRISNQPTIIVTSGATGATNRLNLSDTVDLTALGVAVSQGLAILPGATNGPVQTTITAFSNTPGAKHIEVAADIADSAAETIALLPSGAFPFVVTTSTTVASPTNRFNVLDAVDLSSLAVGSTVFVASIGGNNGKRGVVTSLSNSAGNKHLIINPTAGDTLNNVGSAENLLLGPPTSLVFNNANWNVDQTVTVTGQDDLETDAVGASNYRIDFVVDTSSGSRDTNYDSATPANQFMRNQDDDIAGVRIVQDGGFTTVDEGNLATTDTYRVRLNTSPAAGKVVVITVSPGSQLSVNKTTLVFTQGNFSTEQVVTVTAVNDAIDEDASHTGTITHAIDMTLTDDVTYDPLTDLDQVTASITDNDAAGIVVSPTIGLVTTEANFGSNFTVVLSSQPTANVTIDVATSDVTEGSVSPATLTFTPSNWFIAQNVLLVGVDDDVDDGDVTYFAVTAPAQSADTIYDELDSANVIVVNVDNDVAGVVVTQTMGGAAVTEGSATPDSFTVELTSQPASGSVVVTLSGGSQLSLSTSTLTFTSGDWDQAQSVGVTAVNDSVAEGAHSASIGLSASGTGYIGLSIASINVTITDNDTAGTTVTPSQASEAITTEAGGAENITFTLATQPTANVTVLVSSSATTEGTVSPSSLTFTPGNYATAQTITITGVDDDVADINAPYSIAFTLVSADPTYNNLAVTAKPARNTNLDNANFIISAISNPLREDGTSGRFTLRLTSEPTATVNIGVAASDATEASVSVSSLTFDSSNWNEAQEVTVNGVDDALNDNDQATLVLLTVSGTTDATYAALNPNDVSILTQDDDQAGVAVSAPSITTTETTTPGVSTVTFTMQLLSEPTANVTIPMSSSNTAEGTVSPASLTFTSTTWNIPQTVTVTPVDDFAVDGTVSYTIVLSAITGSSESTGYAGLDPQDISASNNDNDAAAFTLSATTATTAEGATAVGIDVVLTSQPSTNVEVTVTGLDTTEGSLSATTLTFTPSGAGAWNVAQTLTITGVNDALDDGDQDYTLTLTPTSSDTTYNGLSAQTISVTNGDNDAAGVVISESAGSTVVAETGATDTYTVQLSSQPLTVATITVTPDSQVGVNGSATPIVLSFDPALSSGEPTAWNSVRTITVSAVVDTFDETNPHAANITHTVANYVDQSSAAITASPVTVTVNDNDPPQATVASLTVGRGSSEIITTTMISATDDDTFAANLVFTVILAPGQGELWLDYGQIGQDLLINGDTFTQAAIAANRLSYHNSGTPNVSDGFAFRVSDAVGNQGDLTIFSIAISGFIPPIITLNGAYSPSFTEINNPLPVAVDTAPAVSDPDSATYTLLTVTLSGTSVSTEDEVFFATTGPITASSNTILYSGSPIGTYTGGTGTVPLTVTFTVGVAGDAQLTDLFTALRYRNTSEDPVAGIRTVTMILRDDSSTENAPVTKDISVLAINDPPTVANATVITPKNVAITTTLTAYDVDNYPLTVDVTAPPGKGTLSGILDVLSQTTIADASASRSFTYTPSTGQEGIDSFTIAVRDPDGAVSTATITVLIIGGAAARPWIISDAPTEAEAGSPLSYDVVVDFTDLPTPPTLPGQVSYTLIGNLPTGVTVGGFTPSGTNAALTLTVSPSATGVIEAGIVVTETASNTSGYQPVTIVIVPPGTLGN